MKLAVTYENGQVFQHFGHTESFKMYDIADGSVTQTAVLPTNGSGHGALADAGITLYPGVNGDADAAVQALLAGSLRYDPDTVCAHHHGHGKEHNCGAHGHSHDDGHGCGHHEGHACRHGQCN